MRVIKSLMHCIAAVAITVGIVLPSAGVAFAQPDGETTTVPVPALPPIDTEIVDSVPEQTLPEPAPMPAPPPAPAPPVEVPQAPPQVPVIEPTPEPVIQAPAEVPIPEPVAEIPAPVEVLQPSTVPDSQTEPSVELPSVPIDSVPVAPNPVQQPETLPTLDVTSPSGGAAPSESAPVQEPVEQSMLPQVETPQGDVTTVTTEDPAAIPPGNEQESELPMTSSAIPTTSESVELLAPEVVEPVAIVADMSSLREEAPVIPMPAPQASIAEIDDALLAYRSNRDDWRDSDRDRDRDHDDGEHRPWPHNPDPKGWKCDNRRNPHGCQWNDWDHDDRGRPVFYNRFSFDLRVQYFDPYSNTRVEVVVNAGSRLPIDVPRAGDYGFVVVGASSPNVAVNVGFGTFSSAGHCDRHCQPPRRPGINFSVLVNVTVGQVVHPVYTPVYDCGCGPVYRIDNRDYYRYYFHGVREVVGYWETPPHKERYFVPVKQKQNPASPVYTTVSPGDVEEVTGFDAELTAASEPADQWQQVAQRVGLGLIAISLVGLVLWVIRRRVA